MIRSVSQVIVFLLFLLFAKIEKEGIEKVFIVKVLEQKNATNVSLFNIKQKTFYIKKH